MNLTRRGLFAAIAAAPLMKLLPMKRREPVTTTPKAAWIGLHRAGGHEVSGEGYARKPCRFSVGCSGITNTDGATWECFPPWGDVAEFGIYDRERGGNLLVFGRVRFQFEPLLPGDTISIRPGDVAIELG